MFRCLRPDRTSGAISRFVKETLGARYAGDHLHAFESSLSDAGPYTPILFIISEGADMPKVCILCRDCKLGNK